MPTLIAILGAIIAFFVVVLVHEMGHFAVARLVGIKVLRFSIGFGKPIWSHRAKSGVEYVIGFLPLGGYVKMHDTWSAEESVDKRGSSGGTFESKPLLARMAVILAGPIANFLLAVFLFTVVYVIGVTQIKPIVGLVRPHSVAAYAAVTSGDQIIQVGSWETNNWQQVLMALIAHIGDKRPLPVKILPMRATQPIYRYLNLQEWQIDPMKPELLHGLGLTPYFPPIPPVIATIEPNSPASKTSLRENDLVLSMGHQPIHSWQALVAWVENHPNQQVILSVRRNGVIQAFPVRIGERKIQGRSMGYLGLQAKPIRIPESLQVKEQRPWFIAPWSAVQLTSKWVMFHLIVLKQILLGKISLKTLSGPVSIFQAAGTASLEGLVTFLQFVAFISIVLGVFNLMPIPVLDGGQFMFCVAEWVRGKPIPLRVQIVLINFGVALLLMMVLYATMNDVIRLLG